MKQKQKQSPVKSIAPKKAVKPVVETPEEMLCFNIKEIKQIASYLDEIPTKYGRPLQDFMQGVANLRAQEKEVAAGPKVEDKKEDKKKVEDKGPKAEVKDEAKQEVEKA